MASDLVPLERGVFCNRTLNLRSIPAIGYDMDYTLIHYRIEEWERRAYEHLRKRLVAQGWPVGQLELHPEWVIRGLIIDTKLGNILKANRFGYVKRAYHGTTPLDFDAQRETYARTIVELADERFVFLNTYFSVSEACIYMQLVDLLDRRELPEVLGYADLYRRVKATLDDTHMEGQLKSEVIADPDRFVVLDPEIPLTLLDQKQAGKRLLLITNSEWFYTRSMMAYAFDRYLPAGTSWRDLFHFVIVAARKPEFFSSHSPLLRVATEDGLLEPTPHGAPAAGVYFGGNAGLVEQSLGLSGDQILYVGDHVWGDVKVSKNVLRWRTTLILRELEQEIAAERGFAASEQRLAQLMRDKEKLEREGCALRLALQRDRGGYGPRPAEPTAVLEAQLADLRDRIAALDETITPLAMAASELSNPRWGLLMRTGNDKSHLARQLERSADLYTSRVSNLLYTTPFAFLRSPRGNLPHDPRRHEDEA
jgi:HAD superfamily 5'-nucleotidase-like hydrolase